MHGAMDGGMGTRPHFMVWVPNSSIIKSCFMVKSLWAKQSLNIVKHFYKQEQKSEAK